MFECELKTIRWTVLWVRLKRLPTILQRVSNSDGRKL